MTTSQQTRHPRGEPAGGQFAATAHTEPSVQLAADNSQAFLYAAAAAGPETGRAEAARSAINSCREAFEDLPREDAEDLVEELSQDDGKLIRAVEDLGELDAEERHYFGKHLAEQLHENHCEDEQKHWAGRYASERALDLGPVPEDAYEQNDPKHPGCADRLGI